LFDFINGIIRSGAMNAMSEKQFFEQEIRQWKGSEARQSQITGEKYYRGKHDILTRKRTVIGENGKLREVENLPNNQIVDNQYAKMIDQKTNYLLGQPFTIQTENEAYAKALNGIFNKRFHRLFQNLGEDSLNCGIGWIYVYYDETGQFCFKRFAPYEILPFWKDSDHSILDCVVRVYEVEGYEGREVKIIDKVEIYKATGIERFELVDGVLVADAETPASPYVTLIDDGGEAKPYNWGKIPIIGFKYNDEEIPLICKVKSLQDAINLLMSDFQNNMQEDSRNTILVIKNYDGQSLGQFRHNLMTYGAVKVRSGGQDENGGSYGDGGVDALQVTVNSENYRTLFELLKQALIENAMGFDAKQLKSGTPNQMNIQSMYSDVDLDANGMETEYQASFEDLLWFINAHLANSGAGNFEGEELEIIFNRDMLMDETSIIANIRNSIGIISTETLVAQHPWVVDAELELARLEKEAEEKADAYADAFPAAQGGGAGGEGDGDDTG
jgi:SPP1 family phage portal protein